MPGRERHRVVTTHRVADQRHARKAEPIHQCEQIAREVFGGIGRRRRPLTLAVAPLIERNRANARRQAPNDAIKPVGVRSPAVEEENRRRIVGSALQEMQANPVDRLYVVLCLVTSEQLTGHSLRLYGGC